MAVQEDCSRLPRKQVPSSDLSPCTTAALLESAAWGGGCQSCTDLLHHMRRPYASLTYQREQSGMRSPPWQAAHILQLSPW